MYLFWNYNVNKIYICRKKICYILIRFSLDKFINYKFINFNDESSIFFLLYFMERIFMFVLLDGFFWRDGFFVNFLNWNKGESLDAMSFF